MNKTQKLWRESDNIIMTSFEIRTKADIAFAFERLEVSCTINHHRNRYHDNGLLATTSADSGEGGEFEEWLIIAWELQSEAEKQTWLLAGRKYDEN